jgi:hypothetical protein
MSATPQAGHDVTESKAGLVQLVKNLLQDLRLLLRDEVALVRREVRQDLVEVRRAAIGFGAAFFFLNAAFLAWCAAAVVALSLVMDLIWAVVLAAVLLTVAGVAMALAARRRLSAESLRPEQTLQNLEEDKQWLSDLKEQVLQEPNPGTTGVSVTSSATSTSGVSRSRRP